MLTVGSLRSCRVISYFEDCPIDGVRFVHYYCYSSNTGEISKSPTYATIIRALCYRLAWNRDGTVAGPATDLYNQTKKDPDMQITEKGWEKLFEDLVAESPTPIVFIIDALDECRQRDDYNKLLMFLNRQRKTSARLHCLISSRLQVKALGDFTNCVQMFDVVQTQPGKEMERFVQTQIELKRKDDRWQTSIFCRWHPALINSMGALTSKKQSKTVL